MNGISVDKFPDVIKKYRQIYKLSRPQLAKKLDMQAHQIYNIERGERKLKAEDIVYICEKLNINQKLVLDLNGVAIDNDFLSKDIEVFVFGGS